MISAAVIIGIVVLVLVASITGIIRISGFLGYQTMPDVIGQSQEDAIDTLQDAPMFKVSDTHYAKTWLLDPRAPKIEKPEIICNLHEKLVEAFNI